MLLSRQTVTIRHGRRVRRRRSPLMARSRMHRFLELRGAIRTRAPVPRGFPWVGARFRKWPRGRPSTRGTKITTFRTAADSDRVHARKKKKSEREERKRRERSEQKCPAAAAAAVAAVAATHCNAPVHRRVRKYYALSPRAMDRPSNASNLRLLLLFNGNTLRRAMPGIEAGNGAERRTGIEGSAMRYKYIVVGKSITYVNC